MTDATRLRLATYSGSAAASLGHFALRVSADLAFAAVTLASAAAKRSLTDMVRGHNYRPRSIGLVQQTRPSHPLHAVPCQRICEVVQTANQSQSTLQHFFFLLRRRRLMVRDSKRAAEKEFNTAKSYLVPVILVRKVKVSKFNF